MDQKSSVHSNISLEHQQNKFFVDLANLSHCFKTDNKIREEAKSRKNRNKDTTQYSNNPDFWSRKRRTSVLAPLATFTTLDSPSKDTTQAAKYSQLANSEYNKSLLGAVATKKYQKLIEKLPKDEVGQVPEDVAVKNAKEVFDSLFSKTTYAFECFRKPELVNSLKSSEKHFINGIIEGTNDNQIAENLHKFDGIKGHAELDHFKSKSVYTFAYLKYLKKRSSKANLIDYLLLKDNQRKLDRRIVERKADLSKFKNKTDQYKQFLEAELKGELQDFYAYKHDVEKDLRNNPSASPKDLMLRMRSIRSSNQSQDSVEDTTILCSLWERLAQREPIVKKEWKPFRITKSLDTKSNNQH